MSTVTFLCVSLFTFLSCYVSFWSPFSESLFIKHEISQVFRKRGSKIKSHKRTIAFSRPSEPQSLGITDSVLREEHITQEVFKNVWNMILARTYYQSIPSELREASSIDGASEIQHFFKIMMPVCKPIIAVLALWSFVGMWNSYFDAMIYLNDADLQPLQLVLRSILVQNTPQPGMIADIQSTAEMAKVAELLKYATIVVSSLPLLVMYPFFQKYFDKGIMVGSVKG